jgi:hypothetical protein
MRNRFVLRLEIFRLEHATMHHPLHVAQIHRIRLVGRIHSQIPVAGDQIHSQLLVVVVDRIHSQLHVLPGQQT